MKIASRYHLGLALLGTLSLPATVRAEKEFVPRPQQIARGAFSKHLVEASNLVRAAQARSTYNVNGTGLTAAVLDTGIFAGNSDFGTRIVAQRNFTSSNGGNVNNANDGDGHGTHVSGIIMANSTHIGIAPGARVAALKVLNDEGSSEGTSVNDGLRWVLANHRTYNVTVVNMSLGGSTSVTSAGESERRDLIRQLRDQNIAVISAAGNEYHTNGSIQGMNTTAIIPETISVGAVFDANVGGVSFGSGASAATTGADRITPFSNRLSDSVGGQFATDVFAPGGRMTSTGLTQGADAVQYGTSQATPVTAGAVLLMQQAYRNRNGSLPTVAQIESALRSSAVIINDGDDEDDNVTNTGANYRRIDIVRAIATLLGTTPPPVTPTPTTPPITRPANDNFERAQVLSGPAGQVAANTTNATAQSGEPSHFSTGAPHHSVWYRWTASATGSATFSTFGNAFDTVIAAYTGTSLTNLVSIASDDDSGDGTASSITINATRGTTYYIAVDGYGSAAFGLMNLRYPASTSVTPTPTNTPITPRGPANDPFAGAQVLAGTSGRITGTTLNATRETGEPQHLNRAAHSVWYRWTAPSGGSTLWTTSSTNFAATIYSGSSLSALTRVGTSGTTFTARAGTTYFIAVADSGTGSGAFALNWTLRGLPTLASIAPLRARPLETVTLTGANFNEVTGVTVRGINASYRVQSPTSLSFAVPINATTGPVYVTTRAGVSNGIGLSVIAVPLNLTFSPASGPVGTRVTVTGLNLSTTRGVNLVAPAAYTVVNDTTLTFIVPPRALSSRVAVQNIHGTNSSAATFIVTTGIANDNFANAISLSGGSGQTTGNTAGATAQTGEPQHNAPNTLSVLRTVWYRWTAPASGQVQFRTANSSFDPIMAVYTGTALSSLTRVAFNDDLSQNDKNSLVTFNASAGTVYSIVVDVYSPETTPGPFALRWGTPTAPAITTALNASSMQLDRTNGTLTLNFASAPKLSDDAFALEVDGVAITIESIARRGSSIVLGFDATALSGASTLQVVWSGGKTALLSLR